MPILKIGQIIETPSTNKRYKVDTIGDTKYTKKKHNKGISYHFTPLGAKYIEFPQSRYNLSFTMYETELKKQIKTGVIKIIK